MPLKTALRLALCAFSITASLASITPAFADHHHHAKDPDRVQHYEGAHFKDKAHAVHALHTLTLDIEDIAKKNPLEDMDLERIHEISYSLENAIDFLIEHKSAEQNQLDAVDEAVQALHYASENHEEAETREWLSALRAAITPLKDEQQSNAAPKAMFDPNKTTYEIVIENNRFTPEEIRAPAGKKLKLVVHNKDATPEEFESDDFRREKIIPGNSKATIFVGPLKPGQYHYFGEFNLATANGYLHAE